MKTKIKVLTIAQALEKPVKVKKGMIPSEICQRLGTSSGSIEDTKKRFEIRSLSDYEDNGYYGMGTKAYLLDGKLIAISNQESCQSSLTVLWESQSEKARLRDYVYSLFETPDLLDINSPICSKELLKQKRDEKLRQETINRLTSEQKRVLGIK